MRSSTRTFRAPLAVPAVLALAVAGVGCDTNAPDSPGDRFDVDGESPLITDPAGVGNQITNDEIGDDDGLGEP